MSRIAWYTFHDALEHVLGTLNDWLNTTAFDTRAIGMKAIDALREAWHQERFDEDAFRTLRDLANTCHPRSIAAHAALEAVTEWRNELEEIQTH
jgi:hypothetical protein